jgi:acyl dehydratase
MRFLEDFAVGEIIELGSRSLTQQEIVSFARQFDPQPFHVDEAAARQSHFGGIVASGWHTVATLMRMMVDEHLSRSASMGSPGVDEVRWLKPVRPGDLLTARGTVQEVKPSSSKPDRGIIRVLYEVFNQKSELVMTMQGLGLIRTRAGAAG